MDFQVQVLQLLKARKLVAEDSEHRRQHDAMAEVCAPTAAQDPGAPQAPAAVDPRWEFNAPRYYDFEALEDAATCSPACHKDGWFDTSQTAGARSLRQRCHWCERT